MLEWTSRSSTVIAIVCLLVVPSGIRAQQLVTVAPQETQTAAAPPQQGTGQKVAAGEEPSKPTRSFIPALFHNLGDDVKHIPRRNTLYWLAWGTGVSLAIHPADDYLNNHLSTSDTASNVFRLGRYIGSFPVLIGTAGTTYLIGKARSSKRAQHLGMDLIEATLLSQGITQGIKVAVRRDRPLRDDGTRASGFAFPSGHASGTFAAATVLQQHLGWKWAVPTYSIASYVAMSRLHENVHNASDVVFGAAVGVMVGRTVTWHGRNFYASPMLLPKGSGVIVNVNLDDRSALRHH
jgi:membrane-associated phospholipid phosphatase